MAASNRQLILAGASFLALVVGGEAALRLAHIEHDVRLYTGDPHLGWKLRPGAEGFVMNETRQYVRINRAGFRDREREIQKAAHTIRIAVLGNSWTEALQVPLGGTFCA